MMIGFGDYHTNLTRDFCKRVADAILAGGNPETEARRLADEVGTFKDKGWKIVSIRRTCDHNPFPNAGEVLNRVIVVEGTYSHIRDDHPLSRDGYAMMEMPFCVTVCMDSPTTWGNRVHIAV